MRNFFPKDSLIGAPSLVSPSNGTTHLDDLAWQALTRKLKQAGIEYSSLHRLVTTLFVGWRCGADSEALADVTLDRVGRKIGEGEDVRSVTSYSRRIAKYLYSEYCRDRDKFRKMLWEYRYLHPEVEESEEDANRRTECQKACIKKLPESDRRLVLDYYLRGSDRSVLADEIGIPLATLRTQIHRLKLRLAKCEEQCRQSA